MHFRIVEIKNNDLYVIYDVDNGGVCCCSRYTLMKLISEYKQQIEGVKLGKRNLEIQEVGLDGKLRMKKASVICEDETKRSAVTIMKGLSEKQYPRVKQERRSTGSYVKVEISATTNSKYTEELPALQVSGDTFLALNGCIYKSVSAKNMGVHEQSKKVNDYFVKNVQNYTPTVAEKQLLTELYAVLEQQYAINNKTIVANNELDKQIAKLETEKEKLLQKKQQLNNTRDAENKAHIKEMQSIANRYKYKDIKGNELVEYSFMGSSTNSANRVSRECIRYVVERSKRKLLYTHGLAYRHPTTYKQPISKVRAMQIIDSADFLDVDATHSDTIYLNTYSENDMW